MLYQHDGSTAILAPSVFTCLPLPGKAKGVAKAFRVLKSGGLLRMADVTVIEGRS